MDAEPLLRRIAARIHREGPIGFAAFMDAALYDPAAGFFTRGRGAGRAGRDFVTSPEIGPLFGALVARAVDAAWRRLQEPDPFVVVEVGAGNGRLAADVLRAGPDCAAALRYVLVERSPALRAVQRERLPIEPADEVLGAFAPHADLGEPLEAVAGLGPIVCALEELPAARVDGVVLANELLDNLPVDVVSRADDGWSEVRVGACDDDTLAEVLVPASAALARDADVVAADVPVPAGARLPIPHATREWLEGAAAVLRRGEVVIVDYMDAVAGLLARGPESWLRTYREHARGTSPLTDPGEQDITCDVPAEYLYAAARTAGFTVTAELSQHGWLASLGIDALVEEGRSVWHERAHLGDLEAIAGRSRIGEAAALTDPAGLGAHRVVVLEK